MSEWGTWVGIAICLAQSGLFSGLNLAVFSISRLRLEAAAAAGEVGAERVLAFRRNANFTLAVILWGNVSVNVLLAILADSVMTGVVAFLFSTVLITFCGELFPQAFFARHALRMVGLLAPVLRFYQAVLYPVARPTGWMLDKLVAPEGVPWFTERELQRVLRHQAKVGGTEINPVEATGAINFLALDDLPVGEEGEVAPQHLGVAAGERPAGLAEFSTARRGSVFAPTRGVRQEMGGDRGRAGQPAVGAQRAQFSSRRHLCQRAV